MRVPWAQIGTGVAVTILVTTVATGASAHGVLDDTDNPWTAWNVTSDIVIATLLVAALYSRGLWRLRHKTGGMRIWRHVSFFAGLIAVFLALQSPIDPIAERNFLVHQIQHLLIRMVAPMLIFLSAPQGMLVAGMPDVVQRRVLGPVISNNIIRSAVDVLVQPATATFFFIGVLYFWQVPEIHNVALLNDYVHYLMHISLFAAGMLFFWRIFDLRPAPMGTRYGVRLMMLWVMILSNIILGSYLAFKTLVFYPAYDELGRLWYTALTDEQLGSITIWIPNSMMGLISLLIVVHMWGRQETRDDDRRVAKLAHHGYGWNAPPMRSADLIAQAAPRNRVMAFGFAAFVLCVFAAVIMIGVINQMIAA